MTVQLVCAQQCIALTPEFRLVAGTLPAEDCLMQACGVHLFCRYDGIAGLCIAMSCNYDAMMSCAAVIGYRTFLGTASEGLSNTAKLSAYKA